MEDDTDLRERIHIVLAMHFERVLPAANGREGLELFIREAPDIVVCDIRMPIMDGLEMTKRIRERSPETPVIICTAFTDTTYLLKTIELGVSAYVRKPLDCWQLVETINRTTVPILQKKELEEAKQHEKASFELLFGESLAMQGVINQAQRIAGTDFSIVIQGETGVGKSYLASLIHGLSQRKQQPLVTVNVSSLPETLVESQLFGHLKGAFSGAVSAKRGLFEEAHGGTLFLDDVDCASPAVQAKILHAVEQKQFFPVGGTKLVKVDTRIIAASNRDLLFEVQQGSFREDLYYRLGEIMITLPPLRERGVDIISLSHKFLAEISLELNRTPPRIAPEAIVLLNRHPWPGNVRELKSVMKRAALFAGETLTREVLESVMTVTDQATTEKSTVHLGTLEEMKRDAVKQALAATGGKKMEAARLLDVDYSSFKRMLDKYNL
ncbi:sigma-54 dependent transcriptional regulator [Geobacter sp. AOG2]|uniref:sigma-54-dependent transcriptional regulator n=1 Tax=Geobacter sp. AOG2 TaxID=1566347 RepID=UPI001EE5AB97|nr:sigma-54 dependent transcriptional regulator [Geobacter sp. AOG2]